MTRRELMLVLGAAMTAPRAQGARRDHHAAQEEHQLATPHPMTSSVGPHPNPPPLAGEGVGGGWAARA